MNFGNVIIICVVAGVEICSLIAAEAVRWLGLKCHLAWVGGGVHARRRFLAPARVLCMHKKSLVYTQEILLWIHKRSLVYTQESLVWTQEISGVDTIYTFILT